MGKLLKIVGGIWAVIGAGNIVITLCFTKPGTEIVLGLSVIANFFLFILPGLLLCGLGSYEEGDSEATAAEIREIRQFIKAWKHKQ